MATELLNNSILLLNAEVSEKDSRLNENHTSTSQFSEIKQQSEIKSQNNSTIFHKFEIVWINVFLFTYLHLGAVYGLFLMFTQAKLYTILFTCFLIIFCGLGITAGAHRLWSHQSYKAKWPLRLILMIAQTTAHQDALWVWCRDHRVHHKFTDTDADPYNAKRGFFFSHIGWLMVKKHPMVIEKGKTIDMRDLKNDPIVMFQKKYFIPLMALFCFILPTWIPMYCWNETFSCAWYIATVFRYCFGLNATWSVNSVAHIWGMKPYEKTISPSNNSGVAFFALGEGWHNYHHVFPWDYKTAELGNYGMNWSTAVIDFCSKIGWAYNLRTVSNEMIKKRVLRTGDGSHMYSQVEDQQKAFEKYIENYEENNNERTWGWNDPDMKPEDKMDASVLKKSI